MSSLPDTSRQGTSRSLRGWISSALSRIERARAQFEMASSCLWRDLAALEPAPDYILLDSRAGLHDVAGLSLHCLAHVDVLVGRDSEQTYQGLELTLEAMGHQRAGESLCIMVQTMPPEDKDSVLASQARFRKRSHEAFVGHVYGDSDGDDVPDEDSKIDSHSPYTISFRNKLFHLQSMTDCEDDFFSDEFVKIKNRIIELSTPGGT